VATVKLPSNADIPFVSDLKEQMIIAAHSQKSITLDASQVESVSTPLLQLLLIIRNHAVENGIKFMIKKPSESFSKSLQNFGCSELLQGAAQ